MNNTPRPVMITTNYQTENGENTDKQFYFTHSRFYKSLSVDPTAKNSTNISISIGYTF